MYIGLTSFMFCDLTRHLYINIYICMCVCISISIYQPHVYIGLTSTFFCFFCYQAPVRRRAYPRGDGWPLRKLGDQDTRYIYMYMFIHMYVYMNVYTYLWMNQYTYIYICVCVCVYLYVCGGDGRPLRKLSDQNPR